MPAPTGVLSVSGLTALIKDLLETGLTSLVVEGEITGLRTTAGKHLYFSLKDEKAVVKVVWFAWNARGTPFVPEDGQKVRISGRLSVYEPQGSYQLVVATIEPLGLGDLLARLERLKRSLDAEGLFAAERKRPIPLAPAVIGLVTSPGGAALQDMLRIFQHHRVTAKIRVFPVLVQGAEAGRQIATMIDYVSVQALADVLVVGRGGGAVEDLLPFSDEAVVRSIAACRLPVISAVGHEIDNPLSDLAADLRCPTPTAAAETLARTWSVLRPALASTRTDLAQLIRSRLERTRLALTDYRPERLEETLRRVLQPTYQRFDDAKEDLLGALAQRLAEVRVQVNHQKATLEALSPLAVLERGYALVTDRQGTPVSGVDRLTAGDPLTIRFHRGRALVQVKEIEDEKL
ncbi:MAG: exodeoxyribonuclease VII large subunit [Spirochaetales bacterium]